MVKKDRVGEDWTQVAFSKDPDNEPTELEFAGDDTITSLYVPSGEDQGFYAVEVKILDL